MEIVKQTLSTHGLWCVKELKTKNKEIETSSLLRWVWSWLFTTVECEATGVQKVFVHWSEIIKINSECKSSTCLVHFPWSFLFCSVAAVTEVRGHIHSLLLFSAESGFCSLRFFFPESPDRLWTQHCWVKPDPSAEASALLWSDTAGCKCHHWPEVRVGAPPS